MDNFIGSYNAVKTENLEAYFQARGVPWPIRKIILFTVDPAKTTRQFKRNDDGSFTYTDKGSSRYPVSWTFKLGETFQAHGYDNKEQKVTFEMSADGKKLLEHHRKVDDDTPTEFEHSFEGDTLVWSMVTSEAVGKWYYKKA